MASESTMADRGDDWRDWFDRHGAGLVLLARHWTSTRSDAEDVVQEAFIRFWKSRDRVSEPVAYLYACVKRCAVDWRRSRARQAGRDESAARREIETPLFKSELEQEERRAAIEASLQRLPEEQREVLLLRIWGGLTFPQVASALELSVNTVTSRYRYAIEKLRGQLAEERIP
jgi:RNA polymerase sigma-70 factor, ECF subfamily